MTAPPAGTASGGTRVLLADDHRLVREGLRRTLTDAGLEVVGQAADGAEALTLAAELRPDVVLLDVSMPVMDGIAVARRLRSRAPDSRVLVLTMHAEESLVRRARSAGAAGYLLKDASSDEVVAAVERAAAGFDFVDAGFPAEGAPVPHEGDGGSDPAPELTPRETQILQMLADGCSPDEVAERLSISPKTVRNHLSNAYGTLDVSSRSQAIVTALRWGLIELPE